MKVLCISLCAVFLLSCQKTSIEKQINSFPLVESLMAEEVLVPPELLAPSNFFISEDKLVIPQMKMDSVFYIYNLPGCEFANQRAWPKRHWQSEFQDFFILWCRFPGAFFF